MEIQDKELTPEERINAEQGELDSLIEKGFSFKVKKREFLVREPYLGTLDRLSDLFIKMDYDITKLDTEFMQESKRMAHASAKMCAKVIAIAVLNNKWKIRLLSGAMYRYFLWNIQPSKLFELTRLINLTCNLRDFTYSIISMSAARTTKPEMIEQSQKA